MITVFDFETTGLLKAKGNDLAIQPHATEICALQFDEDYNLVYEFESLIKPPVPIPEFLEKQIGITNEMVKDAPVFADLYRQFVESFYHSHTAVAHNLSFDLMILVYELMRIGKEYQFPYPPIHFCTIQQSMHVRGYRLKNGELYKIATGNELEGAHRAKNDVLATFESYKWLVKQKGK